MKKVIFILLSIGLILSNCSKNEIIDNSIENSHSITANYEQQASSSKVAVNENGTLTWSANDAFIVLNDNNGSGIYKIKNESIGNTSGTFEGSLPTANIKGAAFPFTDVNTQPSLTGNILYVNLPSEISFADGICNSPMWATPTTDMTQLSFKHLGSMFRFIVNNIPSDAGKIIIEATSPIAGQFKADITSTGDELILVSDNENNSNTISVTFNVPQNGSLKFHVPIPVGTYNTFAVAIAKTDGSGKRYLKTWNNLTFSRAWPNNTTINITNIEADTNTDYTYDANTSTYTIKTKKGLYWFAEQVNSGLNNFNNEIVELDSDIDLNNDNWTPIKKGFKGTFDGNNKTISNLKAHVVDGAAGLFGEVENCVIIKNVIINNVDIKSNHYAGGIVGWFQENGSTRTPEIYNCKVNNGNITVINNSNDEGDKAGGIVGYAASDVNILNCNVTGLTISGYRDLGGIVGIANSSTKYGNVTISNCTVDENTKIIQDLSIQTKEYIPSTIDKVFGRGSTDGSGNTSKAILIVEIPNVDALKTFAKTINAHGTENHHDFYQKTIKITQELDLNNELWTPIGRNTGKGNFIGIFDGNNMTINNLKVNITEGAGLFGFIKASGSGYYPTIKNIKINNVNIAGNHYAGGVLGYGWGVTLTGCSVDKGNITLTPNTPEEEGKYDNGDKAGGVVGWIQLATTDSDLVRTTMTNCSATNLTITAYRDFGGVAGYVKETASSNQFKNNSASNIILVSNRSNYESNYKETKELNAGEIIGSYSSNNDLDTSNKSTNVTLPNTGV